MTNYNIAVVTSNLVFGKTMTNHIRRVLNNRVIVEALSDELSAKAQLSTNSYHLAVVDNDLAVDENSVAEGGRGLGLLRWLHETGSQTAKALICSVESSTTLVLPPGTTLLRSGSEFDQQLVKVVNELVSAVQQPSQHNSYVKVIVDLDEAAGQAPYHLVGEGDSYEGSTGRSFVIDRKQLKRLADRSREIVTSPGWDNRLLTLGQDVWDELLKDSGFWGAIQNGLGHVDNDLGRMKFCFRVSPDFHALAVEALASSDDATPEWWMLKTLIYRSFYKQRPQTRGPLLSCARKPGSSPINCLIIEADARGLVPGVESAPGQALELDPLPTIAEEASIVEEILLEHRSGRVLRVNSDLVGNDGFEQVLSKYLEEEWHIVHYAGHSFFDETSRNGYLFFPGRNVGSAPEKIDVARFCGQLRSTQFLYLSSCRSSEANLILALAENGIPAAVGFRWGVVDVRATEYAEQFYRQVFRKNEHCLQYAFLETRKIMHGKYPTEPIWAAPMLLYRG